MTFRSLGSIGPAFLFRGVAYGEPWDLRVDCIICRASRVQATAHLGSSRLKIPRVDGLLGKINGTVYGEMVNQQFGLAIRYG